MLAALFWLRPSLSTSTRPLLRKDISVSSHHPSPWLSSSLATRFRGIRYRDSTGFTNKKAVLASAEPVPADQEDRNWQVKPLADLVDHIITKHHKYTREEIARLGPLFDKVCSVHGKNHSELPQMRAIFLGLVQELSSHMMKEEMVLFPYILRMEEAVVEKAPPFGTVQNPVVMMVHEHDSAGQALRTMRKESAGYALPGDACAGFRTLYKALEDFEADLHPHIHLENNILFPRAIEMEASH
jgi:regulator of cell morphogenesis and NO signaling